MLIVRFCHCANAPKDMAEVVLGQFRSISVPRTLAQFVKKKSNSNKKPLKSGFLCIVGSKCLLCGEGCEYVVDLDIVSKVEVEVAVFCEDNYCVLATSLGGSLKDNFTWYETL